MVETLAFHLNPFSQVPNEIIAKVFFEGTETWKHDTWQNGTFTHILPFPDLVAGVCNHWRALSHGTPGLWIFIQPPSAKLCLMWMSKWLERSKAIPVEISLDENKLPGINTPQMLSEILTLLDGCAHRLHRFDIRIHIIPLDVMSHISRIACKATLLQQLSLCHGIHLRTSIDTSEGGNSSWLRQMTCLTRLRFNGLSLPFNTHLTSLDVRDLELTYSDLQAIFGVECRLKHLVLYDLRPLSHPIPQTQNPPMRVDSLETIALSSIPAITNTRDSVYLFSFLNMPNITYLELDCNATLATIFGKSLASAKIDTLKFMNHLPRLLPSHTPENNEDIRILQSFSSLRHLELTHVPAKTLLSRFTTINGPSSREVTRQHSIGSQMRQISRRDDHADNSTIGSSEMVTWPNLLFIRLDTAIAEDVVSLISFTQCHKGVRTIELSTSAMRHLGFLKRKGDTVTTSPPDILFRHRRALEAENDAGATQDVKEWLSSRVDLKSISRVNNLLSKRGSDPLSPLP